MADECLCGDEEGWWSVFVVLEFLCGVGGVSPRLCVSLVRRYTSSWTPGKDVLEQHLVLWSWAWSPTASILRGRK